MTKLTLVLGDKADPEVLSKSQKTVEKIMQSLTQIANGVDGMGRRGLALSVPSFNAENIDIEEVKIGLKETCIVYGVVEYNGGNPATTIDPDSVERFRAKNPQATTIEFDLQKIKR